VRFGASIVIYQGKVRICRKDLFVGSLKGFWQDGIQTCTDPIDPPSWTPRTQSTVYCPHGPLAPISICASHGTDRETVEDFVDPENFRKIAGIWKTFGNSEGIAVVMEVYLRVWIGGCFSADKSEVRQGSYGGFS
jgi:hypothetical protein